MPIQYYIFIALLIILLALVLYLAIKINKKENQSSIIDLKNELKTINAEQERRLLDDNDRLNKNVIETQNQTNKDLNEFKDKLIDSIDNKFKDINDLLSNKISNLSSDMNKNVSENFEKTNATFSNLKESIARLDEAQKNLQSIETSIDSFRDVLTNNKQRGNFGEFQLNTILIDTFGEREEIYSIQEKLSNGNIADVLLKLPEPLGKIAIDSKFSLASYKKMYEQNISDVEKEAYAKQFKEDVKKHIKDISKKYIIKGETANQAMMFVPSEAIFAEINGNFPDLINIARKDNVWIVSPTTIMAILETIIVVLKDRERKQNVDKILDELKKLSDDFKRYAERWDDFEKHLNTVVKDAEKITISSKKITSKFNKINDASIETIDEYQQIENIEEQQ